jgi:hypothetical protein
MYLKQTVMKIKLFISKKFKILTQDPIKLNNREFNSCIKKLSYIPKTWMHALDVPIPKPGKDNWDIPGETTQGWHHGSESLNQIFSTDSPIKLK